MSIATGRRGTTRAARARRLSLGALALVMATLSCKGDGGGPVGPDPVIAGHWSGNARAYTLRFEADFTQDGDSVGGTGEFSSPLGSDDFTVNGRLDGREVYLLLSSSEAGTSNFRGRFTAARRIEGTLDLPGGDDLDLTIDRD